MSLSSGGEASRVSAEPRLWVITRGWGARVRQVDSARRQIFNFLIPGDCFATGLGGPEPRIDAIVALTPMQLTPIEHDVEDHSATPFAPGLESLCRALAEEEVNLVLDHVMRLGQQTALERTAHLLLELAERLTAVHMAEGDAFTLPIKQQCLAQALGMSPVHLNRTLQKLKTDGLIAVHGSRVTLRQRGRLRRLCAYGCEADWPRPGHDRALAS